MRRLLAAASVVAALLSSCGSATGGQAGPRAKVTVATTAYPLFEVAAAVGGKRTKVTNTLATDIFAAPNDKGAAALASSELVIALGRGAQPALEGQLSARSGATLRALEVVPTRPPAPGEAVPGAVDPYFWQDPLLVRALADQVRQVLTAIDPAGAKDYRKQESAYVKGLDSLDGGLAATLSGCERREFVTDDPRYGYFANRYGLQQIGIDGEEDLRSAVARYQPTTVFFERLPEVQRAQQLRDQLGVKVAALDPAAIQTDQARRAQSGYGTYLRLDAEALAAALGCRRS